MSKRPMHPRKRLAKIIRETSQMIRDIQYWNTINPQHQPFDCETERVVLNLATQAAELWDADRPKEANAAMDAMVDYVTEHCQDQF